LLPRKVPFSSRQVRVLGEFRFREVLAEAEFGGVLRGVVFAMVNDPNAVHPGSPEGNFAAFGCVLA